MAAAVIPDPAFSALYNDASKWSYPTPNYEYCPVWVGAPTQTVGTVMDHPTTITMLVNQSTCSPMMIAFDNDDIYVGHSLTAYPSDPANTLPTMVSKVP